MTCQATTALNRYEASQDNAARRELSVESLGAEVMQEMLEHERVLSDAPMVVTEYDINADVCVRIYENHGDDLVDLIRLMLQALESMP